jgi:hypothetical protein
LLSAKSSILSVKGHPDGVKVGLSAELTLAAGPHRYAFDSTITVDRQAGATETTVTGDYPAASQKARGTPSAIKAAFGIPWLTLDDVQLAVTLGPRKSVAVSGKTSLGKVKNLTASVFVDAKGSQVTDFGVSLMGADIGLADIPRFAALKRLPDIRFRDVTISETEVAGTLRTSNSTFNNLRAVVFRTGDKLTLAALRDKFTLEDILQLEGPAKLSFSKIAFDRGLLVISEGGVRGAISSLPSAAAKLLTEVYGDANRRLNLGDGFNLAVAIDTSKIGSIGRLGVGRGKLVLDGGVEGIFGGTPAFDLSVAIPPITFPPTLGFLGGPRNLQTAFFIKLTSADATAGVSVSGDFPVKTKTGSVVFTNTVDFQLDAEGGVSIEVAGTSNSPWPNPFGIHGLTLNPGTTIDVKVSATSEVDLTFIGKSRIGTREVDLTGSAGVLVAEGVLDKGAFEGKVSELKLSDLIALTNTAVTAAGGKMPATNFPEARLTHVDVAFASPGAVVQGMNMVGAGARIAGDLWLLLKNQPLGKLLAQIDGNGVVMSGSVSDLTLGPVALHGNTLDARATLIPPVPPYFKLKGGAKLFGRDQDMDVALSVTDMEMSTNVDLGELLKFDFKAKAGLPGQGLSVAELAKFDMSLNARLRSDLPAWLRGPGRKPVEQAFASVRSGLAKFTDDVRAAQKTVDGLNGQIDAARAKVKSEKRSVEQNLKAAEDHVNALQVSLKQLDGDISEAKSHIHSKCDFWEDKCVVQGLRKCVTSARVPDLSRNASCAADNTRYGAIVGLKTTQRDGVAAANTTVGATLNALRKGVALNDVDLDPRVAPLIVERDIAQTALSAALLSAQGSERASKAIDSALDSFARKDAFVLNDSLIQGSLQKSIAGLPVVLGLDFSSLGTKYYNGFAFSVTDPAFDGEQLATLGLFIASKLLDESYGKDPAMAPFLALVHDAYASRRQAEQARVDAALKENGLE